MPGGPPKLTVSGRAKPDVPLSPDHRPDRVVLDLTKSGVVDGMVGMLLPSAEQGGRPQQAANMIGPKRRHGTSG